jgi:hypothetical protein
MTAVSPDSGRRLPRLPMTALCQKPTKRSTAKIVLFNYLVGAHEERCGYSDAERLRSFQIDDQLVFG